MTNQTRPLRIGFVDLGNIATKRHLTPYTEIPDVKIAALCDLDEEALANTSRKYGVPESHCYVDFHDMIANAELDAVEVCTPNHFHAAPTIAALEAGKHVLCQKPMATTIKDAEKMVTAAEQSRRKLGVIYMQRFRTPTMHGAKIIHEGLIGRPTSIRARTAHAGGLRARVGPGYWRHSFSEALAGSFSLLAVHYADIFRWYLGPAKRLASIGKTLVSNMEGDDNMAAVLEFESGVVGTLESCYNERPGSGRVEVYGDKGTLIIDQKRNIFQLFSLAQNDVSDEARTYFESLGAMWGEDSRIESETLPALSPFANYWQHWVDCLLNDKEPVTDGREGIASLELITASYESSTTGQFVKLIHQ
ncbi:Gfo/Idh/MocA family oxidoreductase [Chloroflexi bacterium TSY]|nr:Gfo/Idh/MocA family oxidoreductase [Chloroflexi bacterium TSY]